MVPHQLCHLGRVWRAAAQPRHGGLQPVRALTPASAPTSSTHPPACAARGCDGEERRGRAASGGPEAPLATPVSLAHAPRWHTRAPGCCWGVLAPMRPPHLPAARRCAPRRPGPPRPDPTSSQVRRPVWPAPPAIWRVRRAPLDGGHAQCLLPHACPTARRQRSQPVQLTHNRSPPPRAGKPPSWRPWLMQMLVWGFLASVRAESHLRDASETPPRHFLGTS